MEEKKGKKGEGKRMFRAYLENSKKEKADHPDVTQFEAENYPQALAHAKYYLKNRRRVQMVRVEELSESDIELLESHTLNREKTK